MSELPPQLWRQSTSRIRLKIHRLNQTKIYSERWCQTLRYQLFDSWIWCEWKASSLLHRPIWIIFRMESPELWQKLKTSEWVFGKELQRRTQQWRWAQAGCEGTIGCGGIRQQEHLGDGDKSGGNTTVEGRGDREADWDSQTVMVCFSIESVLFYSFLLW